MQASDTSKRINEDEREAIEASASASDLEIRWTSYGSIIGTKVA